MTILDIEKIATNVRTRLPIYKPLAVLPNPSDHANHLNLYRLTGESTSTTYWMIRFPRLKRLSWMYLHLWSTLIFLFRWQISGKKWFENLVPLMLMLLISCLHSVLANYMMWRVVLQCFATLGKRWRELAQEYNKVITGQDREEPRWEQCMVSQVKHQISR